MALLLVALALAAGLIAWPFLHNAREQRRRRATESQPLDGDTWSFLCGALPLLRRLDPELRGRFERHYRRFLAFKRFYGCAGLAVTEDMKRLIAAQACLLLLRPQARTFPGLRSILVYPGAFEVPPPTPPVEFGDFELVDDQPDERIGESHEGERVVLSWEDVEAALSGDPVNVVVHEFAHQLDVNEQGAPQLADYRTWRAVMQVEYERLHKRPSPVLDDYGLEGPAEFFAVAAEAYFQQGAALWRHHTALYELLKSYFVIDTA